MHTRRIRQAKTPVEKDMESDLEHDRNVESFQKFLQSEDAQLIHESAKQLIHDEDKEMILHEQCHDIDAEIAESFQKFLQEHCHVIDSEQDVTDSEQDHFKSDLGHDRNIEEYEDFLIDELFREMWEAGDVTNNGDLFQEIWEVGDVTNNGDAQVADVTNNGDAPVAEVTNNFHGIWQVGDVNSFLTENRRSEERRSEEQRSVEIKDPTHTPRV